MAVGTATDDCATRRRAVRDRVLRKTWYVIMSEESHLFSPLMGYVFPRFEIFSGSSLGPVAYTKHDSTTFCHVRSRALLRGRPLFALPRAFQKKGQQGHTLFAAATLPSQRSRRRSLPLAWYVFRCVVTYIILLVHSYLTRGPSVQRKRP